MSVKIWREAPNTWVVHVLFNLLNNVASEWAPDTHLWYYPFVGQIVVAKFFGKQCWLRYKAAVELEELQ